MNIIRRHWLLIIILICAGFLRFYRLSATQTFLEDEGRDLLISYRMLDTHRPVLLGPQTSTGNMYLGPLYYYLTTPALWISQLNPIGPSAFIALTGIFTVYLLYAIGKKIFGSTTGYLAAFLYAVMPLPVTFTRNSWNPNLAPIFALLMYYFTDRIIRERKSSWKDYLALGICAGSLIQMHYLGLLFLAGTGILILVSKYKIPLKLIQGSLVALSGFVLILSPFILFEFRNNFVNTHAITRFVAAKEEHNIRYFIPLKLWSDKVGGVTTRLLASSFGRDALTPDPNRSLITYTIVGLFALTLVVNLRFRGNSKRILLLFSLILMPLLFTGVYQENIHLHYLGFFLPLIYLFTGSITSINLPLKWLTIGIVALSSLYAIPQLISYLKSSSTNQVVRAREVADYIINHAQGEDYNVVSASKTHTTPYLYFLAISTHPPSLTKTKTLFLICQDHECNPNDLNSPFIYITGQAHPTISKYLGHPLYNYYDAPRTAISNEHVSRGVWVARIMIK